MNRHSVKRLQQYLCKAYACLSYRERRDSSAFTSFQIDDQNDYDDISRFSTIFATMLPTGMLRVEISGFFSSVDDDLNNIVFKMSGCISGQGFLFEFDGEHTEEIVAVCMVLRKAAIRGAWGDAQYVGRTINSLQRFSRILRVFFVLN